MNKLEAGIPVRKHLEAVERQTGVTPQELIAPGVLEDATYVVSYFQELRSAQGNAAGLQAISWTEILSWQTVRKIRLMGWEISALMRMDRSYCQEMSKEDADG